MSDELRAAKLSQPVPAHLFEEVVSIIYDNGQAPWLRKGLKSWLINSFKQQS